MLKQRLQQKLLQKLSPQQIQFIKLLQVPTVSLDARIKEELENNPALEDFSLRPAEPASNDYGDSDFEQHVDNGPEPAEEQLEFNMDDYLQHDDRKDYESVYQQSDEDDAREEIPISIQSSFLENLQAQLLLVSLHERDQKIGQQIIGSLDDDGYLRRALDSVVDDLAFSHNIYVEVSEVERILKVIQSFDPPGIGARSLQECLVIQLDKKKQTPRIKKAKLIIEQYLEEFTKKHYDKLEKALSVNAEELKTVIQEILKLNPKPGDSGTGNIKELQIIPDFYIANNAGTLVLTLNAKNAPELRVSRSYRDLFDHYEKAAHKDKKMKEAVLFVKQKLDSAKWFIDAIKQRQQTLLKTMDAIINYQYDYFLTGDEKKLKPMILKDISDRIKMDISTVSRIANAKYVQTEFGTFLLKSFFSEGIQLDSGEEVSNKEVKKILFECVSKEDKHHPLADEKLADILKEQGYNIARRTIAKYREELNIPVARLRKEL